MEAYIEIDGKRVPLTKEQLQALGLEPEKKNPFDRLKYGATSLYYFITAEGTVYGKYDNCGGTELCRHFVANYCTDEKLMEQRALHEILNRLLWRYSMEHGGDEIDWSNPDQGRYVLYYNYRNKEWIPTSVFSVRYLGNVYFISDEIAQAAIEEIIEPFMAEHPEFEW